MPLMMEMASAPMASGRQMSMTRTLTFWFCKVMIRSLRLSTQRSRCPFSWAQALSPPVRSLPSSATNNVPHFSITGLSPLQTPHLSLHRIRSKACAESSNESKLSKNSELYFQEGFTTKGRNVTSLAGPER